MTIRQTQASDAIAIAPLISQLGYATEPEEMRARLHALRDYLHQSFLAESDRRVVGFIGARVDRSYEYDGLQARILALVVDEKYRGRGVGRALIAEVEKWAISRGAHKMMVNTHHRRTQTHAFYESVGFESTGLRFVKPLAVK